MKELAEFMISDIVLIILYFVLVILIQFIFLRPIFNYLAIQGRLTKRNLIYTWAALSVLTGLFFGAIFGDMRLGILDIIKSIGVGVVVFLIYYSVNFITYLKLMK